MTRPSFLRFVPPIAALSVALVAAAPVSAQAPPPGVVPPPPPPPPPAGASVVLDHNGGFVHVDVRCAPADTARACADLATRLYEKLNGPVQAK